MRRFLALAACALLAGATGVAGCASQPRHVVARLDRHDPEFRTRDCVRARHAVARYDDQRNGRLVVGLAGNLLVPFAGTAAALAMNKVKDKDREALNHRVRRACVSDPLGRGRVASR